MATEIAVFTINAGATPGDADSDSGKTWNKALKTILSQKGAQRAYWGIEHENGTLLRLFVDWDSVDSHKTFMKSDAYQPMLDEVQSVIDLQTGQIYHANPTPFPPAEAMSTKTSPATELLHLYFPSNYSRADQDKFHEDFHKLLSVIKEHSEGTYTGGAGGWVIEELDLPDSTHKARVYFGAIGWKSIEHHLAFRTTEAFKKNIHLLREAKDIKKLGVVHFHGEEVSA